MMGEGLLNEGFTFVLVWSKVKLWKMFTPDSKVKGWAKRLIKLLVSLKLTGGR